MDEWLERRKAICYSVGIVKRYEAKLTALMHSIARAFVEGRFDKIKFSREDLMTNIKNFSKPALILILISNLVACVSTPSEQEKKWQIKDISADKIGYLRENFSVEKL